MAGALENGVDMCMPGTSTDMDGMENGGNLFAPDNDMEMEMPNVNAKTALVSPSNEEYEYILELIKERVEEGQGETIYEVGTGECDSPGLKEEDMEASSATLKSIAETLDYEMVELRSRQEKGGMVREFLLRKQFNTEDFMEVRVAVVGNVDAGKSTLLGVLTHGDLDNGRGLARMKLFRHKHEMESGRTSSVGNDILGFDTSGKVVNKSEHGHLDWVKICEQSAKVITFIDLAGHERYLKTTVFGMTGHAPDFAMLMIGANAGIIGMTKEHLGLALALQVPVFVVITKIDMCPANVLEDTLKLLQKILKSPGCRKMPVMVQNKDDVICSATNFTSERMCPVFQVSNVTGENMDLLKMFLNLLSTRVRCNLSCPAEFQIDDTFSVPGVGTVVSGTVLQGYIKLNDTLMLGPDPLGQFQSMVIKSIHRKRMPVREVRGGQTASFALKKIKRSSIRKGMVMVSPRLNPQACWEFEGEILVLHHPTTISVKYQAMVEDTLKLLQKILKSPGCRKMPVMVQNKDDVICSATNFTSERMCPVFQVSNVTGENMDLLKMFLNLLSTRVRCNLSCPAEFQIDDTFSVPGVGTVVSGTVLQGYIKLNDTLMLGPDPLGQFQSMVIKSIHRKRMPVREVRGGQTASFALKKIKRSSIRKGMVMVSPRLNPQACWEFEGEILVLHHPTTISVKYQAMVHVGSVRQTATILTMTSEHLRTGDKSTVRFRFIKNPEYLRPEMRMVFREGRTKAIGTITKLYPHIRAVAQNTRQQRAAKKAMEAGHQGPRMPQNEPQKPSKKRRGIKHKMMDYSDMKENERTESPEGI